MKSKTVTNLYLLMAAMFLNLGLVLPAPGQTLKMMYSGTSTGASAVDLKQPGTLTVEENFEGHGALGAFTFRLISAETKAPQEPPSTCAGPNNIFFLRTGGTGVFRFQDGSLLIVRVTHGADCIDLSVLPGHGHCTLSLKILGGTHRLSHATGTLRLTETNVPVLLDALGKPVFFVSTGDFTGTVSAVEMSAGGAD